MGENRMFGQVSRHAFVTTPFFSVAELKHITSDVLVLDHPAKDGDK